MIEYEACIEYKNQLTITAKIPSQLIGPNHYSNPISTSMVCTVEFDETASLKDRYNRIELICLHLACAIHSARIPWAGVRQWASNKKVYEEKKVSVRASHDSQDDQEDQDQDR